MSDKYSTDFLFAQPSFLSGAARTMDAFATFDRYNTSDTPTEADMRAIASDWGMVGQDLSTVVGKPKKTKK